MSRLIACFVFMTFILVSCNDAPERPTPILDPNYQPPVENNISTTTTTTNATKTPEPAQNAAGVWHYICNAGCSGGAGSATACSGCGATLTHNAAYHQ